MCLALGLASAARAQAPPRVIRALQVEAPTSAPAHTALAEGLAMWLRVELAALGLPVEARGGEAPDATRLRGELRVRAGVAELRLRLADAAGATLAGVSRQGRLLDLGTLGRDAGAALLERAALPAGPLREAVPPTLEELARAGRALAWLDAGELARARRELSSRASALAAALGEGIDAAATAPDTPPAARARVLLARGDVEGARALVAAEPGPEADAETLLAAAELAREQNNPRRERDLLARAVAAAPGDGAAQLAYGRSLAAVSPAEARPVLEQAARLRGDDPEPLEALAALPGASPDALLGAAERAAGRFEVGRAERLLAQARAGATPARIAESERRVGDLQLAVGDAERARSAYQRAVELAPGNGAAWKGLAGARRAAGDGAGAESAYREALEIAPDDTEALTGLGGLVREGGRAAEARPVLERALALAPGDETARVELARALAADGEGERALALLEHPDAGAEPLRAAAELHRGRGDAAAAGRALDRALERDPDDPALHRALAELRESEGATDAARAARDQAFVLDGAEAVAGLAAEPERASAAAGAFDGAGFLAEIATSFPTQNERSRLPIRRVTLLGVRPERGWRALAARALAPRQLDLARLEADLAGALATRFELVAPEDTAGSEAAFAPAPGRGEIARLNDRFGTHALFVARVIRAEDEPDWRASLRGRGLEVRMLLGADADVATLLANAQALAEAERAYAAWNPIALGVYALAALVLAARALRGWGTLVVRVDYDRLGASFFTARVSRKPGRVKATARDRRGSQRRFRTRMRELGRFQRTLVGHEVRFRWLPAREWHVAVHGLLESPITKEVIGRYFDEKPVRVSRWQTTTTAFDFRATECSLEVTVTQQGQPIERAAVALAGVADSLRYSHKGAASFTLGKGRHTVVIGHAGRVVERRIRIEALEPASLMVDLAADDGLVFADCPAAVEPYLAGARDSAAAQLEHAGQHDVARRLRGDAAAARGDRSVAAELFEQSGRYEDAAQAWLAQGRPERAARCFDRLARPAAAAEAWRAAGDLARAGQCFEQAGEYDEALDCYGKAGERQRLVALLEKTEAFFEAAQAALEDGDRDRAISNLQRLAPNDVHYVEACRKLGEIFADRGELPLAIAKLDDAVAVAAVEHLADLQQTRAELLMQADRVEEALEAFEEVRRRDFHRAGVAEQMEAARARLAAKREADTRVRTAAAPAPAEEERYEIQGELGRGGMGIVYRAFDKRLGRAIALKRLPESLREHPKVVELFLREARAAAQLNHPNIVTVHDVDQRDGSYFITMECLEGLPLNALLRRHQRFPAATVARIGTQVAAGLGFAHARHIVHRDIKTANLFMTRDKVVKIMDFGLAKSLAEVRRSSTVIGGTPYYMAPEQAVGEQVDGRADLYALGVTFFELATGTLPFTEGEVIHHHRHTPAPDPRERCAEVPEALALLILRMLAKARDDRPASAAEVAAALKPLLRS